VKGTGNGWSEATEKTFPAKLPGWNGSVGAAGGGR